MVFETDNLQVERTLFRFVHRPHGRKAYFITLLLCTFMYILMFSVDTITTSKYCEAHHAIDPRTPILMDPRCNYHWLFFGPNIFSLGVLLWLVLSVFHMLRYWNQSSIPKNICTIRFQWALFVLLLGYAPISLISYYEVFGGVLQPSQLQVDKIVAFCIISIYGIVGAVVIEPRQFIIGVEIIIFHMIIVLIMSTFGYFVYAPFLEPNIQFIVLGLFGYITLYLVFSYIYYGIYLLKTRIFHLEPYELKQTTPSVHLETVQLT